MLMRLRAGKTATRQKKEPTGKALYEGWNGMKSKVERLTREGESTSSIFMVEKLPVWAFP